MVEEGNLAGEEGGKRCVSAASSRFNFVFIASCVALALLKLWLVRGDEVACLGSPFDDVWYVQSAKDWYWLRSYDSTPFGTQPYIRLPAFPLYIALVNLTGLPLRIAHELLFLSAAFVFAGVLAKAGLPRLLCLLLYVAIAFHPASFLVNSLVYTDTFYAPVLLLVVSSLILLFIKRDEPHRLRYAVLAGASLALLWHVRQENIIIVGFLVAYALLMLVNLRVGGDSWPGALKKLGVLVLIPAAVILLVSLGVKTVNYARFRAFSADAMFTSDFKRACKALLRIKPAVPIRFVPVPREVRLRAYQVSPAFRQLESYFEGETGLRWASYGMDVGVQVPGEISAGHFWWAFNQATYEAGYNKSARQANRFYRRMADEIDAACADGRLQCRTVLTSLVDPHTQNYLPHLPESFGRVVDTFTSTDEAPKPQDMPNLPTEARALFDSVTNRRAAMRTFGMTRIRGWAFDLKEPLASILLRNEDGQVLARGSFFPRADVAAAFKNQSPDVPLNTGFDLEIAPRTPNISDADLVFITEKGKEFIVRRPGAAASTPGDELAYNIDLDETLTGGHELENSIQRHIWSIHGKLVTLLTCAGLCALLLLVVFRRSVKLEEPIFTIMAFVLAVVAIRVAVFTFIDASAYIAAIDIRYTFPVMYLYTCVLLMLVGRALGVVGSRLRHGGMMRKLDFRSRGGKMTR